MAVVSLVLTATVRNAPYVSCASAAAAGSATGATSGAAWGACAATITWRARTSPPSNRTTRSEPSGRIARTRLPVRALTELAPERRRQAAGPAEQVARDERARATPHEGEQADSAAGRELIQLRGGAVGRAGEDLADGRRQGAEERLEGPVVFDVEAPARSVVAGDGALDPEPCPGERDSFAYGEREPERITLEASAVEDPGAHCQGCRGGGAATRPRGRRSRHRRSPRRASRSP